MASNEFFIIAEGTFAVSIDNTEVARLTCGRSFGEIALLYNCPRTATVKSIDHGLLWVMDRIAFRRILMTDAMRRRQQYVEFLKNVPVLRPLCDYEYTLLADALELQSYNPGDHIMCKGDRAEHFFMVLKGTVLVEKDGESYELREGCHFGDFCLLRGIRRVVDVYAKTQVELATLSANDFFELGAGRVFAST
eukprot:TRINITY_DN11050_c0_g1_i1.p2 TRINITY_DN11050_c0_g1~~TRINITY_DN11050_c0_g1_i1.p2  ORF type:complete len:214 (+),score=54.17 TRINITY_DN11050_c0_g1_i1:66-644(+)